MITQKDSNFYAFSIYNASAGSGKTYALVKEYLKIILSSKQNDTYRNILAITFTNKAVHEMKSRIVGSLSQFTQDQPDQKALELMEDLSQELKIPVSKIQEKSKEIIKHIIHNYAAFDISTIDKFTHRVIRTFALDLQLPMSFEVSLDTENLLTEAVDNLIAQAGEDETLTKLLVDFTMEKADDDKSWDVSREILNTGKLLLNENNREEIEDFKSKSIEDFTKIKSKIFDQKKVLEDKNIQIANQIWNLIVQNNIDEKSFSRGTFPNHIKSIKESKFNPNNKTFHEESDIVINKTAKDRDLIEQLIPEMLRSLKIAYANFAKIGFYNALLKNITPLSLLNKVSQEFASIQKDQNILSIAEFNSIIHNEIQNQPAPFIYERLGERYKHFFIDEFQDTSQMQWQNLIPLIDNALSSEDLSGRRGSLMIVGDPKQSIYRWRGGKAEQFIDLSKTEIPNNNPVEFPFSNKEKKVINLGKNYRSYSEVINFNNLFFKYISGEFSEEKYQDLYQNFSWQETNSKNGGHVSISFIPAKEKATDEEQLDKTEMYLQKTLHKILEVQQHGFDYSEIVIVVRKNKDGIAIANYLTEQNIPIQSSETLLLSNSSDVKIIIHTLKYLNNARDLESKAHILNYIATNYQTDIPTHDFIAQGMSFKNESAFAKWLLAFNINLSFENIRKKSLYEATEIIVKQFLQKSYNAYIQFFLDIVLERDMKYQAGIADFLNYWDKKSDKLSIPSPENTEAIRIISIHKSKGLEFPVVIFPFADEDYTRQPKDKLWLETEDDDLGLQKALIDNNRNAEQFSESAAKIYHQKNQERLLDNINVLYVALTRAEEQLHIISQQQKPNKSGEYPDDLASYFMKYLEKNQLWEEEKKEYCFGNPAKISKQKQPASLPKNIDVTIELFDFENIKIAQREALMWGSTQQDAIEYGNIIHEILSYIHTKSDIQLAIEKAITNGLISKKIEKDVTITIEKIVNHPELIHFFDLHKKILNETIIIRKENDIAKPDRIAINTNNDVYLLDYKTGAPNDKYQKQIETYTEALQSMKYQVAERALVYIGEEIKVEKF